MAIRDRGKLKWQPASFLPLAFEMQREMFKDQERMAKPIIDEYEREKFDQRITHAMELNLMVRLTVWVDGFTDELTGRIRNVDLLTQRIRVEVTAGEFKRVAVEEVVKVAILD